MMGMGKLKYSEPIVITFKLTARAIELFTVSAQD